MLHITSVNQKTNRFVKIVNFELFLNEKRLEINYLTSTEI